MNKYLFLIRGCFFVIVMLGSGCQQSQLKQDVLSIFGQIYTLNEDGSLTPLEMKSDLDRIELRWSPDGTKATIVAREKNDKQSLWVAKADSSEAQQVIGGFDFVGATWLNNNILITGVATKTGELITDFYSNDYLFNLQDKTMQVYPNPSFGPIAPLPSGEQWITSDESERLFVFDLAGQRWPVFQGIGLFSSQSLSVSSSKPEAVVCGAQEGKYDTSSGLYYSQLEVGQNRSDTARLVYPVEKDGDCDFPHWSPDGRYVAFRNPQGILILEASTFSKVKTLKIDSSSTERDFIWSPDSRSIVVSLTRIDIETEKQTQLTYNGQSEQISDWRSLPKENLLGSGQ